MHSEKGDQTTNSKTSFQDQPYMRIIKDYEDPAIRKLKRGKDTPSIHVFSLRDHMAQFKEHYKEYWQEAKDKVIQVAGEPLSKRLTVNTTTLDYLFGGSKPNSNDPVATKQFIINRINAKVLELIYQKYLPQIVFGGSITSKIEDKLTSMIFVQEYRSRLLNPLLCAGLETFRPKSPQKKTPNNKKAKTQKTQETINNTLQKQKTKKIRKKDKRDEYFEEEDQQ